MPAERFTGQARDGEAGLDYFHARQYQPRTGRFNAVDPVYAGLFDPQQWNRYAYAVNRPTSVVDPTGMAVYCVQGQRQCVGTTEAVSVTAQMPPDVPLDLPIAPLDLEGFMKAGDLVTVLPGNIVLKREPDGIPGPEKDGNVKDITLQHSMLLPY